MRHESSSSSSGTLTRNELGLAYPNSVALTNTWDDVETRYGSTMIVKYLRRLDFFHPDGIVISSRNQEVVREPLPEEVMRILRKVTWCAAEVEHLTQHASTSAELERWGSRNVTWRRLQSSMMQNFNLCAEGTPIEKAKTVFKRATEMFHGLLTSSIEAYEGLCDSTARSLLSTQRARSPEVEERTRQAHAQSVGAARHLDREDEAKERNRTTGLASVHQGPGQGIGRVPVERNLRDDLRQVNLMNQALQEETPSPRPRGSLEHDFQSQASSSEARSPTGNNYDELSGLEEKKNGERIPDALMNIYMRSPNLPARIFGKLPKNEQAAITTAVKRTAADVAVLQKMVKNNVLPSASQSLEVTKARGEH